MPEDYFVGDRADGFINRQKRGFRFILLVLKNLAGAFLLIMGIIMLFVPGQGILTIIAGLSVMNFPGKRRIELRLASNKKVMKGLNWIRDKGHRNHFHEWEQVIS
nr:PGPGW domain-containing protein [Spirochaeta isovalerica]